jgi:hypothetical protein
MNSISLSIKPHNPVRPSVFSIIPLPQINHFLSLHCHNFEWSVFSLQTLLSSNGAAEKVMKIYLLMMLIGTLLTAIHFTSAPEGQSKRSRNSRLTEA